MRYDSRDEVSVAGCESKVCGGGESEVGREMMSRSTGMSNVPSRLIIGGSERVVAW